MDELTLRHRYRKLMERRVTAGGSSVPLETLEALAEDRIRGPERIAALEAVYADPAARAEFEFLREIARERPGPAGRGFVWRAAAAIMVVVAGGLVWRASSPEGPEPLRGPEPEVALLAPAVGARLAPGETLVWRRSAGTVRYSVEVVTEGGEVAFRGETTDTTIIVTIAPGTIWPSGPAQWWVTAQAGGNAGQRSAPRRVVLAPPP